jgi:DNA-binding MarR family transcriptional regulator
MRFNGSDLKDGLEGGSYRELRLLEEVDVTPETSQRYLASRLGIALGVANLLVKNLAKKGYIRATRAGWKRWVYNLTPAGVGRKAALTLEYVDRVLDHHRRVRLILRDGIGMVGLDPESRLAIYGTSELAELMYLVLTDMGVTRIDFFDRRGGQMFLGSPVRDLGSIESSEYVKVMVAYSSNIEERCDELLASGVASSQMITLLQRSADVLEVVGELEEG